MDKPDRWPDKPPRYDEVSREDLIEILQSAINSRALPQWEHGFCESIIDRLEWDSDLSEKQIALLDSRIIKVAWENSEDLWDEVYDKLRGGGDG